MRPTNEERVSIFALRVRCRPFSRTAAFRLIGADSERFAEYCRLIAMVRFYHESLVRGQIDHQHKRLLWCIFPSILLRLAGERLASAAAI